MTQQHVKYGRRPLLLISILMVVLLAVAACGQPESTETGSDADGTVANEGVVADGTVHEVSMLIRGVEGEPVPEFYFEPSGLFIEPGDTVRFVANTPHHTATAYHELQGKAPRVPENTEPFSSPVVPIGDSWSYTFDEPGVYDLWCGPHEQYGMAMRIVVGEASGPGTQPPTDFGPEGTFGAAGTVLLDPALDPDNIISNTNVSWDEISAEAKQPPMGP